ncbi:uncharacterized protein [Elaeis guineensis]|uniref:Uncharacterized protein LOC105058902 n=1 Tax=Elaeis guineensis var. tenera TaxID=51953 RepID=A0A6I9SB45_ELAGV|nr:uncharacterized protein LOC105058902 [Elaeis guineensis]
MHNSKSDEFYASLRLQRMSPSRTGICRVCIGGGPRPSSIRNRSPQRLVPSAHLKPLSHPLSDRKKTLPPSISLVSLLSVPHRAFRPVPQFFRVSKVPNFLTAAKSLGFLGFIRFLGQETMDPETDEYIRESIENSLGLPISDKNLRLKLLASEDARHRLQDQIFVLEERLKEAEKRVEQYKAEATMNAQGLRRCIEEKEIVASGYNDLVNHCAKLEKECSLYERDLERVMESCDELAKENDELRSRLQDDTSIMALAAEVESLKKDKENLRINLHRAEEEVKVLFEENKMLDEENKRLLGLLKRERHHHGSDSKRSASASAKGKRKSSQKDCSPLGRSIDFNAADSSRQPLSPLHQNSPDCKMHKHKK